MRTIFWFVTIISALAVLSHVFSLGLGNLVYEYAVSLTYFFTVLLIVGVGILLILLLETIGGNNNE